MATKKAAAATPKTEENSIVLAGSNDAEVLVSARTRFTRESALAASESTEAATDYAKDALTAWTAAEAEGVRASVYAAMAAAAAVKSGLLIDGTKPEDAAEGVMSPKEWGAAWITPKHSEGVSRQMVDTWIRAGEAFLGWGLDPESPEGKRLLGGLAQSKEWNAERKAIREALADEPDADPAAVAELVTAKVAEVRLAAEQAEADRKAEREAEKAKKALELKEALAKGTADAKAAQAPEKLSDRVTVAEQIIASLRPSVAAERAILEDLAARIAIALSGEAESAA